MTPEQPIIVDRFTLTMLGKMARMYGLTYGEVVELLVMEKIVQDALRGEAATVAFGDEIWAKIKERLRREYLPDSVDLPGQ